MEENGQLETGLRGEKLWGKKSRDAGGVEAGGCADNDSSGSERKNADSATIPGGTQRAPQARKPPCPNQEAKTKSPPPPEGKS